MKDLGHLHAFDSNLAPEVLRRCAPQVDRLASLSSMTEVLRSSPRLKVATLFAVDLISAQRLARSLMAQHGVAAWSFKFDRASRRFGSCWPGRKLLTLSWKLTMLNDEAQVTNTLLHEIAHALTPGDGHGAKWRSACKQLGIEPERCFTADEVAMPARRMSRYEVGCDSCRWWHPRHRIGGRSLICKHCRVAVTYRERESGRRFRIVSAGKRSRVEYLDQTSA